MSEDVYYTQLIVYFSFHSVVDEAVDSANYSILITGFFS